MNAGSPEVESFRALVGERLGLAFDDTKLSLLAETLRRRAEASGCADGAYLRRLSGEGDAGNELRSIAQDLTVTETYFFRAADQIRAFVESALPRHLQAVGATRKVRVLSAGCASGEEPYSLAIAIRDLLPSAANDVSIVAVDVNPAMLEKARRATYTRWSLREMGEEQKRRWFRSAGPQFELDAGLRRAVTFKECNLANETSELWQPGAWDIVFCRNTAMYFDADTARRLIWRIARALAPGGHLFLGHAETLRGLSEDFHLCHTHGAFYYQLSGQGGRAAPLRVDDSRAAVCAASPDEGAFVDAESWIQAIDGAAKRIDTLAGASRVLAQPARPEAVAAEPDLAPVIELLQGERFRDALARLADLPSDHARRPDVLLLRAVSAIHGGTLDQAEDASRALLERDKYNPGAHYVLALCREGQGDMQGAEEEDLMALRIDPGFAMARLHLGLLARRRDEPEIAREELARALAALRSEQVSRLELFGGGFGREALLALCEAELSKCGSA